MLQLSLLLPVPLATTPGPARPAHRLALSAHNSLQSEPRFMRQHADSLHADVAASSVLAAA